MYSPKVLSFHYNIETEMNMCWSNTLCSNQFKKAIQNADAVILPQGCNKQLYALATENCSYVFPNYDAFHKYPDKIGQIKLFKKLHALHPRTITFENYNSFHNSQFANQFEFPFVFKLAWGGEGKNVFLITKSIDLEQSLSLAKAHEQSNKYGFLIQEYIPTLGRSLRVTVIGDQYYPYWRVAKSPDQFYTNLRKGARIDRDISPELQTKAVKELKVFCEKSSINLAGFDFLFSAKEKDPKPLFLEINYFFRCKGLGGQDNYMKLFEESVRKWIKNL